VLLCSEASQRLEPERETGIKQMQTKDLPMSKMRGAVGHGPFLHRMGDRL
jgi:hypothetical protein